MRDMSYGRILTLPQERGLGRFNDRLAVVKSELCGLRMLKRRKRRAPARLQTGQCQGRVAQRVYFA